MRKLLLLIAIIVLASPLIFGLIRTNATVTLPINMAINKTGKWLQNAAESSPFVWGGNLYYVYTDRDLAGSTKQMKIVRFSDQAVISTFGSGYGCQDALVDSGTLYVYATNCYMDASHRGNTIVKFTSTDLTIWSGPTTIKTMDGSTQVYNVSVTKNPDISKQVLAYEVETSGCTGQCVKFIDSSDTSSWSNTGTTLTSSACPEIEYMNSNYYIWIGGTRPLIYNVDQNPSTKVITTYFYNTWETWMLKTSSLSSFPAGVWSRLAQLSPTFEYEDINTTDLDMVEFDSKVYMFYLVSNQVNYMRLTYATYDGTMQQLADAYWQPNP